MEANKVTHKVTEQGKTYWNKEGAYQEEFEQLVKELVPQSGYAGSDRGELIRAIMRLQYEYYNNGNCNAKEEVWGEEEVFVGYGDDGEEVYEYESVIVEEKVSEFFQEFIDLIKEYVDCSEIREIEQLILNQHPSYSEEEQRVYVNLFDKVISYVLNMK